MKGGGWLGFWTGLSMICSLIWSMFEIYFAEMMSPNEANPYRIYAGSTLALVITVASVGWTKHFLQIQGK